MTRTVGRGHEALRRGRWSAPGAEYFLTICTEDKQTGLSHEPLRAAIFSECARLESKRSWVIRTFVVMPDHVHLLIALGETVDLVETLRMLKGRLSPHLRVHGLRWERGCFDHRVRVDEDRAPLFRYIFLNPYRAGIVATGDTWPGYFCSAKDWAWFGQMTNEARPYPEWLA